MSLFYPIFTCYNPDQYSEYGSGSTKHLNTDPIRIRIHNTAVTLTKKMWIENIIKIIPVLYISHDFSAGLGFRINFLRIRIQLFFSMPIPIQLLILCGAGSSLIKFVTNYLMKSFLKLKKTKRLLKSKNHGACPNLLNFEK